MYLNWNSHIPSFAHLHPSSQPKHQTFPIQPCNRTTTCRTSVVVYRRSPPRATSLRHPPTHSKHLHRPALRIAVFQHQALPLSRAFPVLRDFLSGHLPGSLLRLLILDPLVLLLEMKMSSEPMSKKPNLKSWSERRRMP